MLSCTILSSLLSESGGLAAASTPAEVYYAPALMQKAGREEKKSGEPLRSFNPSWLWVPT